MRRLEINPQKFDISLVMDDKDIGHEDACSGANVTFVFGETTGNIYLLENEAEKIGKWFLALAKELRK